jgi:hypothetical protein
MKSTSFRGIVILLASSFASTFAAAGTLNTYTTSAAFSAAAGAPLQGVGFDGIVPSGGFTTSFNPPGYTDPNTGTILGAPSVVGSMNVTARDFYTPLIYTHDFLVQSANIAPGTDIVIALPRASTAFSLDYGTFNGSSTTFTLSNGDTFTAPTAPGLGGETFLGFVDSDAFTSITISTADIPIIVDAQIVAPLPTSIWAGIVLFGCFAATKLRRQTSAQPR